MLNVPNLDQETQQRLQRVLASYPGYDINQDNGQRLFGPSSSVPAPPPPPKGCEVFVGRLPRDMYEDELVPVFSRPAAVYKLRLMMDFSGSTRGYAFVQYATRGAATLAVDLLHNAEVRPGHRLAVTRSLDNCRLYIGGLSPNKSRQAVADEVRTAVGGGAVKIFIYADHRDAEKHRGFAFVEFATHREAALARRALYPSPFGEHVTVDWADPELEVADEIMMQVKVLFVRNVDAHVSEAALRRALLPCVAPQGIEKVKKCKDFAFVHFFTRASAERCKEHWNGRELGGTELQVSWAKPVSRAQHSSHKMMSRQQHRYPRGNGGPLLPPPPPSMGIDQLQMLPGYQMAMRGNMMGGFPLRILPPCATAHDMQTNSMPLAQYSFHVPREAMRNMTMASPDPYAQGPDVQQYAELGSSAIQLAAAIASGYPAIGYQLKDASNRYPTLRYQRNEEGQVDSGHGNFQGSPPPGYYEPFYYDQCSQTHGQ